MKPDPETTVKLTEVPSSGPAALLSVTVAVTGPHSVDPGMDGVRDVGGAASARLDAESVSPTRPTLTANKANKSFFPSSIASHLDGKLPSHALFSHQASGPPVHEWRSIASLRTA